MFESPSAFAKRIMILAASPRASGSLCSNWRRMPPPMQNSRAGSLASARQPCRAAFPHRRSSAPLPDVTEIDPEVLQKGVIRSLNSRRLCGTISTTASMTSRSRSAARWPQMEAVARTASRNQVRRRPLHPPGHLVDGIQLRRESQAQRHHAQCRALAGDTGLCRRTPGEIARTQLIAALKILQTGDIDRKPSDRVLGRAHGPHPVHPDQLSCLCRRHGRQWQTRYLDLHTRRAGNRANL
jgi:membrane-bound lytic murein transglycosylase B